MIEVVECPICGSPRRLVADAEGTSHFAPARGTWVAIADALDVYHARNLLEALRLVPDTGDWHGSLRAACQGVIDRDGELVPRPNQTAEQMADRATEMATAENQPERPAGAPDGPSDATTSPPRRSP